MIELIFVIVVIGILASIAMPKLWVTRTDAIIAKGRAEVSTIRSAIATERQKSMLQGSASYLDSLDKNESGNIVMFGAIMQYGDTSSDKPGHWSHDENTNTYTYHIDYDRSVVFTYNNNTGIFDCNHTDPNCNALTR